MTGEFREFEGALEVDRDGDVRAHGTIKVESLDTGVLERDQQLLSRGSSTSTGTRRSGISCSHSVQPAHTGYRMLGELDIRGVTRQVVLKGTVRGRFEALGVRAPHA